MRNNIKTVTIWSINMLLRTVIFIVISKLAVNIASDVLTAKSDDMVAVVDIGNAKKLLAVGIMIITYGLSAVILNIMLFIKANKYSILAILLDIVYFTEFIHSNNLYDKNYYSIVAIIIFCFIEIAINIICKHYIEIGDTDEKH